MDKRANRSKLASIAVIAAFSLFLCATVFMPVFPFGATDADKAALSLAKAASCVVLAFVCIRLRLSIRATLAAAGALASLGLTIMLLLEGGALLANLLAGAASGLLLMTIATLVSRLRTPRLPAQVVAAFLFGSTLALLFAGGGRLIESIAFVCAFGLSVVLSAAAVLLDGTLGEGVRSLSEAVEHYRSKRKWHTLVSILLNERAFVPVVGAWTLSFCFGFFESDAFISAQNAALNKTVVTFVFVITLAYYLAEELLSQRKRFRSGAFSIIGCLAFLAAFATALCLAGADSLTLSIMFVGLNFCWLALWETVLHMVREQELPAPFLFALLVTAPIALLRMLGKVIPSLFTLATGQPLTQWQAAFGVLVLLSVLLVGSLTLVLRHSAKHDPREDVQDDHEAPELQVAQDPIGGFCREFGITKREEEVLRVYTAGRSAARTADELHLSEFTVKTYIRRIYSKLEIHSRQELKDLVEEWERDSCS